MSDPNDDNLSTTTLPVSSAEVDDGAASNGTGPVLDPPASVPSYDLPHFALKALAAERNHLGISDPVGNIFDWVNGQPKVNVVRLSAYVERGTRFRAGPDGGIYRYEDGVYIDDGEAFIRSMSMALLAGAYKRSVVGEVVQYFLDREGADPLSFDPDAQNVIRTPDGILDMKTWSYSELTEENSTRVQIPWRIVQGVTCPDIDRFLMECHHNDREVVNFLYVIAGYCMLTRNPLRTAVLLFGPTGHNGKSIFLWLLTCLLGRSNVAAVPLQRLGGDDRFSPAKLVGKLANICGDIGPNAAKDMSLFKQITGGDPIHAERKFGDPFDFICGATPIFSANEYPGSPDTTKAYKGRWQVVPWTVEFEENSDTEERLKSLGRDHVEMEGFALAAAWAVHNMLKVGSFVQPDVVRDATEAFWRSVDPFESWVSERVVLDPTGQVTGPVAYESYKDHALANGSKNPLGRNRFYDKLVGLEGVWRADSSTDKYRPFMGLRLTETAPLALVQTDPVQV